MPSERRRRGIKVPPPFCIGSGAENNICPPPARFRNANVRQPPAYC
ncbi:hypothetical protein [Neisseria polysaccharea]